MKFSLPDQLPATTAELDELRAAATAEINVFQARAAVAGEEFTADDVARLEYLNASVATIDTERATLAADEQSHSERVTSALAQAAAATAAEAAPEAPADETDEGDGDGGAAADVVAEAEAVTAEAAAEAQTPVTAGTRPVSFAGAAPGAAPDVDASRGESPKGWHLVPSAPKYAEFGTGEVGFAEIARSIASVDPSSGQGMQQTGTASGGLAKQSIASLSRQLGEPITDGKVAHDFIQRLGREIPGKGKATAEALVAAGGWCAPSQRIYTFCAVPQAANLISVPDAPFDFSRGGVIAPVNPDISTLLAKLFHYTEVELEAVDGQGVPTVTKPIIDLPCPDEWLEWRLEAIGWAAKAGILQRQAWPEAIQVALEMIQAAHQHRVSQLTIGKMVAGSGPVRVVPTDAVLGATSSVLNGLAINAVNLRIDKGLADDAVIEGVAPLWFREVLRADLALRQGLEALAVTDAQIDAWLAVRHIYLQYVVDWQKGGVGQPGNLDTQQWPGFADVMLYPAGTWFRTLSNVITVGVQYPLDLLQKNEYSHIFTEDQMQVGRRCDESINLRVPLCVNGAVGARERIECSGVYNETVTKTVTIGGSVLPTGGQFPVSFSNGGSANIAWNSTSAAAKTALGNIDDGHPASDFSVAGGPLPGAALAITYPAELGDLSATTAGLTGGTGTTVTVS